MAIEIPGKSHLRQDLLQGAHRNVERQAPRVDSPAAVMAAVRLSRINDQNIARRARFNAPANRITQAWCQAEDDVVFVVPVRQ